jgi:hypothetical protein
MVEARGGVNRDVPRIVVSLLPPVQPTSAVPYYISYHLVAALSHRSCATAGATVSPSMPLRATEFARKPLERISVSVALIT